jgi:hypothetical protein
MALDPVCVKTLALSWLVVLAVPAVGVAQPVSFGRLPADRFDVVAPSARVSGPPGGMTVRQTACRTRPAADVRRRVVDVAVQEWAFFGFSVVDRMNLEAAEQDDDPEPRPRRRPRLPPEESARLAPSIAGYWSATPAGSWILARQNREWNGPDGIGARWQYPWSAAFISWVMCEGGLGPGQFQRAVAHHVYIDQAIRARTARDPQAAFVAYDVGDAAVEPGDLLCSARRPAYRTIADRLRQMGDGARTHCDVVVQVDAAAQQLLAIGGNVRGLVSLKVLPGVREQGVLKPRVISLGRRGASAFVHLKLRAPAIQPDALDRSPTVRAIGCAAGFRLPPQVAAADLLDVMSRSPGHPSCAE